MAIPTVDVTEPPHSRRAAETGSSEATTSLGAAAIEVSDLTKRFGSTEVLRSVSLRVEPGSVVALLGPSGCGKTTLLRTIAGLETPEHGEVRVAGELLTSPGRSVPPERRRIGMVFQDWALFPHLNVAQNVGYAFGRRHRHHDRVDAALALVGLDGLGDRQPGTLSGGQQQRVALARALAPEPSAILLDEPFSNLDTSLRVQVRSEVHRLLAGLGVTTVFVTHDQEEAFVLGDEVAVMHQGVIVQQAEPTELYNAPTSAWVATFVGEANLLAGQASGDSATTAIGRVPIRAPQRGSVEVVARPEEVRLDAAGVGAVDYGSGDAVVELVEYYGHDTVYVVRLDAGGTVKARVGSAPTHRRGDRVAVSYAGPPTVAWPTGSS